MFFVVAVIAVVAVVAAVGLLLFFHIYRPVVAVAVVGKQGLIARTSTPKELLSP